MIQINDFKGDQTDISDKTKTLGSAAIFGRPVNELSKVNVCVYVCVLEEISQLEAIKAMSTPTHKLFPLFPQDEPSCIPAEGDVGELMRKCVCDTADAIELDANEEEHIE